MQVAQQRRGFNRARHAGFKWLLGKDGTGIDAFLAKLRRKAHAANSAKAAVRLWELHDWLLNA